MPSETERAVLRPGRWVTLMLGAGVLALLLAVAGCGSDDDAGDTEAGTTSTSSTTTDAPDTSATTDTTASTETSATETSETSGSTGSSTADGVTAADLELALEAVIPATYPEVGGGQATCQASGPLADWQPVLCQFLPDEPVEFGGVYVSMLDGGRYAWEPAPCCDGGPEPEVYPAGLLCRDLVKPPPDLDDRPDSYHLTYGLAVYYWLTEGRPDRMDADVNGRPCETIYPADEVAAFWSSATVLEPAG